MAEFAPKPSQPEELTMLRHRFGRIIEVWTAYSVFLKGEVEVGPDRICFDQALIEQTTHTLLIAFYSFVYSLFDPSGVSFPKVSQSMLDKLTPMAREARALVISVERQIHSELAKIRSNIGFHQGNSWKKHQAGYGAYNAFHPLAPLLIMQGLRVFFREVEKTYQPSEEYMFGVNDNDTRDILELCRSMKEEIHINSGKDLSALLIDFGQRLGKI